MENPFLSRSPDPDHHKDGFAPVLPRDTVELTQVAPGLGVERDGTIALVAERNQTRVVAVENSVFLPVGTGRANASGSNVVGLHAPVIA